MNIIRWFFGKAVKSGPTSPRLLGIFAAWRLQAYGYALAIVYAVVFYIWYKTGIWLVDSTGVPLPDTDFTYWRIGGTQVVAGKIASLYDPAQLTAYLKALVGSDHTNYPFWYQNWPYPPIFFLMLGPLAMLPYVTAFLSFQAVALLGCIIVVFLIVRRPAAIALVLASPFGALDIRWAQTGFLRASLLGGALLALEGKPVLAGVAIGCLTYKPQFGILIPVALIAAKQWRAFASAAITAAFLAVVSIAAFGVGPWEEFPRGLLAQAGDILVRESHGTANWTWIQTVYGLVRAFHGSGDLAWFAQGCVTAAAAMTVWLVWRSPARYPLKAALLSAATLIASPYAWADDLTVIAIPVAFLAKDQIGYGLLQGEQTIMLALFGIALGMLVLGGGLPLGPFIVITLIGVILRRVVYGARPEPTVSAREPSRSNMSLSGRSL